MSEPPGAMDRVIERITGMGAMVRFGALPSEAVRAVKRHMVDALGCALAGYHDPVAVTARSIAGEAVGRNPATVLGEGRSAPAELAAFANGVMIRCLDLNDTYVSGSGIGHPSDYIAAVLAAADEAGATGRTVVEGVVLAYEVFCRLTDAARYGVTGWDHVSNGAVASAAGAAHVLGLPREQMANAISLAAVANFALHETRIGAVSMWKGCASANACRNGIFAARLARHGVTGPPATYEGRSGVISTAAPGFDLTSLRASTDRPAIMECHLKRYPAGFFAQSAIDAGRTLHRRLGDPARITEVRVGTFPFARTVMAGDPEKWAPGSRESADHSLPFLVATALLRGDVRDADLAPGALTDPAVRDLLAVLTVEEDAESAAAWPEEARTSVSVTLAGGRTEHVTVRDYEGHRRNPMTDAAVSEKFMAGARGVLGEAGGKALLGRLWEVDQCEDAAGILNAAPAGSHSGAGDAVRPPSPLPGKP